MLKRIVSLGLVVIFLYSTCLGNAAYADSEKSIYNKSFFDDLKRRAIIHALKENKISVNDDSLTETLDKISQNSAYTNDNLQQELKKLEQAEYIYLTLDGDLYSSDQGYLGKADKAEPRDESVTEVTYFDNLLDNYNDDYINPLSKNNPTPTEVNGGTTGVFYREQLNFNGFDGVNSRFWIPRVKKLGEKEQPWMYYGFDAKNGKGIEGGFSYQTGREVWQGYIRFGKEFEYSPGTWEILDDLQSVKFYIDNVTFDAYLQVNYKQVVVMETSFNSSDLSTMSVKRVMSIAKDNFNGYNITGEVRGGGFLDTVVSSVRSDYYYPWEDYSTYSYWDGTKWFGTIDWPTYYIHYVRDMVQIYY
ncbi:hypothetical protein D3C74_26660 [compost metagenome]